MKYIGILLSTLLLFCSASFVLAQNESNTYQNGDNQKSVVAPQGEKNVETQSGARDQRYRIGYQDSLEIQVFRHPELGQRVNVNPNGTIYLARMDKPMVAVCKTERELADEIAAEYKSFLRNPFVNVVVIEQKSQSFGVIGAVEKPGTYYVNRPVRLLELIAFAGGPNKEAGSRVIVARTGSTSACRMNNEQATRSDDLVLMDFKIKEIQEGKQNLWMQPGDIVSVLEYDLVYVYGNVNKQGEIRVKEPKTLRQVIAAAEGFAPAAKKDKIRVLRHKSGANEWEEFIYNLKEIDSGKVQDPILMPNDIVAVSEDAAKNILRKIGNSFTQGIPSLFYRVP